VKWPWFPPPPPPPQSPTPPGNWWVGLGVARPKWGFFFPRPSAPHKSGGRFPFWGPAPGGPGPPPPLPPSPRPRPPPPPGGPPLRADGPGARENVPRGFCAGSVFLFFPGPTGTPPMSRSAGPASAPRPPQPLKYRLFPVYLPAPKARQVGFALKTVWKPHRWQTPGRGRAAPPRAPNRPPPRFLEWFPRGCWAPPGGRSPTMPGPPPPPPPPPRGPQTAPGFFFFFFLPENQTTRILPPECPPAPLFPPPPGALTKKPGPQRRGPPHRPPPPSPHRPLPPSAFWVAPFAPPLFGPHPGHPPPPPPPTTARCFPPMAGPPDPAPRPPFFWTPLCSPPPPPPPRPYRPRSAHFP